MTQLDALVLAGGRCSDELQAVTGCRHRALIPYKDLPFLAHGLSSLRNCNRVARIAVVGPNALTDHPAVAGKADIFVEEQDTIEANLLAGVAALRSENRFIITASDNPLVTGSAMADFIDRIPKDAAAAYPYLRYSEFLKRFPGADNIPVHLSDGTFIGGNCVVIEAKHFSDLERTVSHVLSARKSLLRMALLLGPYFAIRLQLKRASSRDAERRASKILGLPFHLVPDCDPTFAIDIDEPSDFQYLCEWTEKFAT